MTHKSAPIAASYTSAKPVHSLLLRPLRHGHHSVCGFAEKWRQKRLPLPARKHRSRAARRADARNHAFVRFQALQGAPPHPRCVQHLHRHQIIALRKNPLYRSPKGKFKPFGEFLFKICVARIAKMITFVIRIIKHTIIG